MIGKKIIFKESLASTNNYVANLLSGHEISHGTVILAGIQTKGKGQMAAVWDSEPFMNLTCSIYLEHENLSVNKQFELLKAISLSVADLLKSYELDVRIKWPNDLLVGKSKISGILIENQLEQNRVKSSIVGIGLNVNQTEFGTYNASSLHLLKGETSVVNEVLLKLIACLNDRYQQFQEGKIELLSADYRNLLWLNRVPAPFRDQAGDFEGIIQGTDEIGRLLVLNTKTGEVKSYQNKELVFLSDKFFE